MPRRLHLAYSVLEREWVNILPGPSPVFSQVGPPQAIATKITPSIGPRPFSVPVLCLRERAGFYRGVGAPTVRTLRGSGPSLCPAPMP